MKLDCSSPLSYSVSISLDEHSAAEVAILASGDLITDFNCLGPGIISFDRMIFGLICSIAEAIKNIIGAKIKFQETIPFGRLFDTI